MHRMQEDGTEWIDGHDPLGAATFEIMGRGPAVAFSTPRRGRRAIDITTLPPERLEVSCSRHNFPVSRGADRRAIGVA
jgi:hypothetical protein